jgi:hypothetical protein|tara:strand:+ start:30 stop:1250 length:1221 start_codon:yes stop_codon:yes gene_type:complete
MVKTLLNLCDLFSNKVADIVQELLSHLPVLDKPPTDGLPKLEDVIEAHSRGEYEGVDSVHVSARIGDIMTDPEYNRGDNLRYGNQERDLNGMGGFSYQAAGTLVGFLRPDGCRYVLVITQGNNRVSMLYAVTRSKSARIPVLVIFHKPGISQEEMVRVESENHNADCNFRSNQSTDEKFKSAYFSEQKWAKLIYNFLKPFGIGIAGTLEDAKFNCTSHSYIDKARKEAGDEFVKRFLETHVDVFSADNCEKEVFGNFVRGGSFFLSTFSAHIAEVDEKNGGIDSFGDMMRHYFADREKEALSTRKILEKNGAPKSAISSVPVKKCLTQADITQGNRVIKGYSLFVCRFVSIYNEYCKEQELIFNQTYATAIPVVEGKTFANFIKKEDPILRPSFIDVAKNPVVHKD